MREPKVPAVYIIASRRNGTIYAGVTSDLCSRIVQHKEGKIQGFSKRYNIKMLVWFEYLSSMEEAIKRETRVKTWLRKWKLELIEKTNPDWKDLFEETCGRFIP